MRKKPLFALLFLFLAAPVSADIIKLKNGQKLEGQIVEDNASALTLGFKDGTVRFYPSEIEWVIRGTPEEIERKRQAAGHYHAATAFFAEGNYLPAALEYGKAADLQEESADLRQNVGSSYARARDYVKAAAAYEQALRLNPRHAPARVGLAGALLELRKPEPAFELYRGLIAEFPGNAEYRKRYMAALFRAGRYGEAARVAHKALFFDTRDTDLYNDLGSAHGMAGRSALAARFYRKTLRLNPLHPSAASNLEKLA